MFNIEHAAFAFSFRLLAFSCINIVLYRWEIPLLSHREYNSLLRL